MTVILKKMKDGVKMLEIWFKSKKFSVKTNFNLKFWTFYVQKYKNFTEKNPNS